ncbi:cleavage and polyadenylation specificity factor subunit 7-like [Synchiropus splendidus]|uniref:cleavage and polyadenylation specificity factor subunit 7-like n=1 Tax=Synchiropus splendidus TaxID=270530 RepID=UPI00237D932A|nr:cleavage and polyadenylation specificity factor subunit 7-like [Synchiropus splendidus]
MDDDLIYADGPGASMERDADSNKEENHEDLDKSSETNDDLFDAVLTGSVDWGPDKTALKNKTESKKEQADLAVEEKKTTVTPQGKLCLYVGHFPWWVSDEDLVSKAKSLGVCDVVDIKFAENKANGQSRGYAELTVSSDKSFRTLMEKLPNCTMNGEKIECRYASRHNLGVFAQIAQQRFPLRAHSNSSRETYTSDLDPPQETGPLTAPPPFLPPPLANAFPSQPSIFPAHVVPPYPLMPPNIPPPIPPLFPPPLPPMSSQPPPSLHLNPAFLPPRQDRNMHQMMDHEFEDLINRNRAVASSAITKAVTGATTGDHQESMETLLTAIAIIKQSRVYSDDRCQALVTSLKDCLVSIQGNGTHGKSSFSEDERDRVRDHDRDRDRDRDRKHSSSRDGAGGSRRHRYRDRSRSRERDRGRSRGHSRERSRERSREQGRHREYRERYR